jgi:serine/threonine-protein kinase
VIQACAGLAVAHAAGVVHRDIKPGNLFLTKRPSGEPLVVIVDFGISKVLASEEELSLTLSQTTLGSPLYMSPEQIRDSKNVDRRTDVWSLGVVLRFLLTGRPAFTAGDASGVLAAVIADEPAPLRADLPTIDPGLEDVVSRCLQKKPGFRYGSVAELANALAPFASEKGAALARTLAAGTASSPPPEEVSLAPTADAGTFASTTRGPRASAHPLASKGAPLVGIVTLLCAGAAVAVGVALRRAPAAAEGNAPPRDVGAPVATSPPSSAEALASTPAPSSALAPALDLADGGPPPPSLPRVRVVLPAAGSRRASPPSASSHPPETPIASPPAPPASDPLDTAK